MRNLLWSLLPRFLRKREPPVAVAQRPPMPEKPTNRVRAVLMADEMGVFEKGIPTECQDNKRRMHRREIQRCIFEHNDMPLVVVDFEARVVYSELDDVRLWEYLRDELDEPDWITEETMVQRICDTIQWLNGWRRIDRPKTMISVAKVRKVLNLLRNEPSQCHCGSWEYAFQKAADELGISLQEGSFAGPEFGGGCSVDIVSTKEKE